MKETTSNKNNYWKWILIISLVISVFLLLPFFINYCYTKDLIYKWMKKPEEWTSFWGMYLGVILSTLTAFIILYLQYKQNNKNNKRNMYLQINILKYQQNIEWLNNVKLAFGNLYNAFNINNYIELTNNIITSLQK